MFLPWNNFLSVKTNEQNSVYHGFYHAIMFWLLIPRCCTFSKNQENIFRTIAGICKTKTSALSHASRKNNTNASLLCNNFEQL